jgi:hypothetical protein
MAKRREKTPTVVPSYTAEELKAIYTESRRKFTAADLQKYTVIETGIPLETVIGEMEEIHRKYKRKKA